MIQHVLFNAKIHHKGWPIRVDCLFNYRPGSREDEEYMVPVYVCDQTGKDILAKLTDAQLEVLEDACRINSDF